MMITTQILVIIINIIDSSDTNHSKYDLLKLTAAALGIDYDVRFTNDGKEPGGGGAPL